MTGRNIGIVVLAAGGSSRLGVAKQLLEFEGKTILRRAAENALHCNAGPVFVVLGNDFERSKKEIADLSLEIIFNRAWGDGIASSIKIAVDKIVHDCPAISSVMFTLCDQPWVDHRTLSKIAEAFRPNDTKIVASEYNGTLGVPAIFDVRLFKELRQLEGDAGAKSIIYKYFNDVVRVAVPEAAFDIDSAADYERLVLEAKRKDHANGPVC